MKIAVPKERRPGERRVAASPETVRKLLELPLSDCTVTVETGAGLEAAMTDAAYREAGAEIGADFAKTVAGADVVLKVQRPTTGGEKGRLNELSHLPGGARVIAMCDPWQAQGDLAAYAKAGLEVFALELMPRITRAQDKDVLSSQANLAGYRAVVDAAATFARAFPMMMTAAGTVPPARVLVMGAGVAGLQAIATARRMGAVVSATDVRPAAKEQVESLGASFVAVEDEEFKEAEAAGGYAKEMSDAYKAKQAELIAETLKKTDIAITTAQIPGRPAPRLISEDMVKSMKPGSVIVDLAAANGGNCALTEPDKAVKVGEVTILGHTNWPSRLAVSASALYARNILNLLKVMADKDSGTLKVDTEDAIIKAIRLTDGKAVIHPDFAQTQSAEG